MGKSERTSGHNFERKIARWLRNLGIPADRNLTETQQGNSGDVIAELKSWSPNEGNGSTAGPRLLVQAKFRKTPSPWKGQQEADDSRKLPSDIAIGVCRRKGDQTLITMRPDTFAALITLAQQELARKSPGWWEALMMNVSNVEDRP